MRIATWNIEWFAELFDDSNRLLADEEPSHRHKISRAAQADAIAWVLERIDADLTVVIEAPDTGTTRSTVTALEGFAAAYGLRQTRAMIGFPNHTMQEIAALYDPGRLTLRHLPMKTPHAPRFDATFRLDVDVDDQPDVHSFSKPPLELELTADGIAAPLRLIGVHAKSKAPHKTRSDADFLRVAIANRRKQLAQCVWLRRRIDDMLAADLPVIVLGDLNDGPGIDHYEKLFGRSSVEVVLGDPDDPGTLLHDPHAETWLNPRQGWTLSTARFYHRPLQRYVNALLDYIMVSPEIRREYRPRWRIWHPFDDPRIYADEPLRDALLTASDHFPVSIDLG
ncbi:endonuclease [Rhodobacteraceae bacterium 2CG4]|uniref:Endonuclease n=1 Tax=Halovulum marinum TaxID=2662447 RepID=A0A6L5YW60_9RHOB|nr:endonuclease [Halovulum marinum]MSU88593.1 endonuclease [Halovulum marinum]